MAQLPTMEMSDDLKSRFFALVTANFENWQAKATPEVKAAGIE